MRSLIVVDFAGRQLRPQFVAALAAGDVLAPGFGRQGEFRRRPACSSRARLDTSSMPAAIAGGNGRSTPLRTAA